MNGRSRPPRPDGTGTVSTSTPDDSASDARTTRRAAWIGLVVAILLIAAAMAIPALTHWNVHIRSFPPLHAEWRPRLGFGTLPSLVLGALGIIYGTRLSSRVPWWVLLTGAFVASAAWMTALATVDGLDGIAQILDDRQEYLPSARRITDIGAFLHEYISRIPLGNPQSWPTHLAGHPPGAVLFFVALVRIGLGSGLAAGIVVVILAATTSVAVLVTLRRLGAEDAARRAAPFLVLGPAAIWMAVSADALFGAVAAWGICCLALAATARARISLAAWALAAGVLLGYCVMLSYGLPLLAILAIAVLLAARTWRPLPWAAGSALVVVLAFAVGGFAWWEAYPVLRERYYAGIARIRPFAYWVWGNLAALAFSAGPILGSSVAAVLVCLRRWRRWPRADRTVILLVLAAVIMIAAADLSGMSKAEVERIWIPFVPWLLLGTALLPERWRRFGLAVQIIFALLVQHLFFTGW